MNDLTTPKGDRQYGARIRRFITHRMTAYYRQTLESNAILNEKNDLKLYHEIEHVEDDTQRDDYSPGEIPCDL